MFHALRSMAVMSETKGIGRHKTFTLYRGPDTSLEGRRHCLLRSGEIVPPVRATLLPVLGI